MRGEGGGGGGGGEGREGGGGGKGRGGGQLHNILYVNTHVISLKGFIN